MRMLYLFAATLLLGFNSVSFANSSLEQKVMQRCSSAWQVYGSSRVTRCYKKDIAAIKQLNRYSKQHHEVIRSCLKNHKKSGYSKVKQCTEQRIAMGPSLPDVLNMLSPFIFGVGFK